MLSNINRVLLFRIVLFSICILATTSCSRKSVRHLEKRGVNFLKKEVPITAPGQDKIQIQYLGCGGLFIHQQGRNIIIDPFFSNPGFMKIGKTLLLGSKIKSKPSSIAFGRQRLLDSLHVSPDVLKNETKAIFAAHGHYDHLMDIPFIHADWFAAQPNIYVNNSSFNSIKNVIPLQRLNKIDSITSSRNSQGEYINIAGADGTTMRVYPIQAAHNPHAKNIKLFSGSVQQSDGKYQTPSSKSKITNWLEGRTMSFLIDIEKNNQILFRLFVQSSSCDYPDGLPPESLLQEKSVDVAVLGVASYVFSEKTYPSRYLEHLHPGKVMFIHWEDFFRNYKKKPKSVLKNDLVRFFKQVVPISYQNNYLLPLPGVVLTFEY